MCNIVISRPPQHEGWCPGGLPKTSATTSLTILCLKLIHATKSCLCFNYRVECHRVSPGDWVTVSARPAHHTSPVRRLSAPHSVSIELAVEYKLSPELTQGHFVTQSVYIKHRLNRADGEQPAYLNGGFSRSSGVVLTVTQHDPSTPQEHWCNPPATTRNTQNTNMATRKRPGSAVVTSRSTSPQRKGSVVCLSLLLCCCLWLYIYLVWEPIKAYTDWLCEVP